MPVQVKNEMRFKEFNGEKKTATKTSNMFKIVLRIGTCDAGFSSSKCAILFIYNKWCVFIIQ
jgi:hypothetical protein